MFFLFFLNNPTAQFHHITSVNICVPPTDSKVKQLIQQWANRLNGSQARSQTMNIVVAAVYSVNAYTHIRVYNAVVHRYTVHTYYVCMCVKKNAFVKTIKSTLPTPQCSL